MLFFNLIFSFNSKHLIANIKNNIFVLSFYKSLLKYSKQK